MIGGTDLAEDVMLSHTGNKILASPYGWKIGEFVVKWHGVHPDLGWQAILQSSAPGSPSKTLLQ